MASRSSDWQGNTSIHDPEALKLEVALCAGPDVYESLMGTKEGLIEERHVKLLEGWPFIAIAAR